MISENNSNPIKYTHCVDVAGHKNRHYFAKIEHVSHNLKDNDFILLCNES